MPSFAWPSISVCGVGVRGGVGRCVTAIVAGCVVARVVVAGAGEAAAVIDAVLAISAVSVVVAVVGAVGRPDSSIMTATTFRLLL